MWPNKRQRLKHEDTKNTKEEKTIASSARRTLGAEFLRAKRAI
jgi:hypothetical protein